MKVNGARVLITGAGSGIGKLMALEAQRRGAQVIAWDRDEDALATLDGMQTAVVDVTDREAVYAQAWGPPPGSGWSKATITGWPWCRTGRPAGAAAARRASSWRPPGCSGPSAPCPA